MIEHEGILTPEQVTRIKARERKQKQRARERSAEAAAQAETPHQFWQRNISVAQADRLAELEQRQSEVLNLLSAITDAMTGRVSPDLLFPEEVDEDVKAEIAGHGICQIEVYLLEFWKDPEIFMMLTERQDATAIFARYGLVTAIPGHRLHEWQTWLESNQKSAALPQEKV